MTLSAFLLSFLFSSVIALLFHSIAGGRGWRIIYYLVLGWLGFALGQILGSAIAWAWLNVGPIKVVPAAVGCLALLFLGRWLGKGPKRT